MSVWLNTLPSGAALTGAEGALVSITVCVEARYLESLLEALAGVDFPINPEIYHDAALVYHYADGRQEIEPVTLVEFPAYGARVDEVRVAIRAYGFPAESVHVTSMLDQLHFESRIEPAPAGAAYTGVQRVKQCKLSAAMA